MQGRWVTIINYAPLPGQPKYVGSMVTSGLVQEALNHSLLIFYVVKLSSCDPLSFMKNQIFACVQNDFLFMRRVVMAAGERGRSVMG